MSDGSSPGYTNASPLNPTNGPSHVYTLNYAAGSAGQQLIVRWILSRFDRPEGNVTLQAATLSSTNANNPPFVALTSPGNNEKFTAGSNISLIANASDSGGGGLAKVEFFANDTKLGEDTTTPYSFTWNNAPSGYYVLTAAATDNQGATSVSSPVEIFVNGSGGALGATRTVPPSEPIRVNLTTEGTRDWAHWGLSTNSLFNHKANVSQQISHFTKIGTNAVQRYSDNYTGFTWSDGTPTASATNTTNGVFTTGVTNGFELTVPADTTSRTLKVYVGLYGAQGNLQAWLSDFSSPAYTDTTLSNFFGNAYGVYTLTYAAASPGQSLIVRYRSLHLFDQDFGNVTLQAASLVVNAGGNAAPFVSITNPPNEAILAPPASFTLQAEASDSDGTISSVEFFNGSTSLGVDTSSPYSVPVSSLGSGSYTFSAVATDSLGAKATNSINLIVNSPPTASISSPTNGQSFTAPANVSISTLANDNDGTVSKVEFFQGATKLGEDTSNPYSLTWSNVAAGSYSLTVRATDDRGATTTSPSVNIIVSNSVASSVTLLNPHWTGSDFLFSFAGQIGHTYDVEYIDALGSGMWPLLVTLNGNGSILTVTNKNAAAIQRFYRVQTN